jgi:rhomboid protease GluP
MDRKLTKTFLSKRPSSKSFAVAALSLLVLFLLFYYDRQFFSANGFLIYEKKEYWRAFTTTLLHADLNHFAHNAFFFTGLAALLHSYFGFWVFPILSLIVGGLINFIALAIYPPQMHLVGVSGVIYFMASFWLTLYILIERRQKLKIRFIHALAISLIFLFPESFQTRVSYLAHGLGFVFGVPMALAYYFFNKKKIRDKDVWIEINKDVDFDYSTDSQENFDHQVQSEDDEPSQHVSGSSQSPKH